MWKNMNKPDFGVLDGLKVVHSATNMAGPMGATMLADHGADLIWLENPRIPDTSRSGIPLTVEIERRNCRTLALDIPSPQGREIFKKILEDADIYIEGWKPGTLAKWGAERRCAVELESQARHRSCFRLRSERRSRVLHQRRLRRHRSGSFGLYEPEPRRGRALLLRCAGGNVYRFLVPRGILPRLQDRRGRA